MSDGMDPARQKAWAIALRALADGIAEPLPNPGNAARTLYDWADELDPPTQPRIRQPGLYGVVDAALAGVTLRREFFCIVSPERPMAWITAAGPTFARYDWDDLIDPVLIREGMGER